MDKDYTAKSIFSIGDYTAAGGTITLAYRLSAGVLRRAEAWVENAADNATGTLWQLFLYDSANQGIALHLLSQEPLTEENVVAWDGELHIPDGWELRAIFNGVSAISYASISGLLEVK